MIESGIYAGTLHHRRHSPRQHEFTYPIFLALLDIDRLSELMQVSPFASYNRANLLSYQERDHFGDVTLPLRERIRRDALAQDQAAPEEQIFLLTHLRTFGYNFNPVSFFYCYREHGFDSVLAEVNNTFGETHNYWLTGSNEVKNGNKNSRRYQFGKEFHVSPFLSMKQSYDWSFSTPGDDLIVKCMNFEDGKLVFDSTLQLERREWNGREVHRALLQFPLLTMRVIAGIHWQALRLMLKGVRSVQHPGPGHFTERNVRNLGASWKRH